MHFSILMVTSVKHNKFKRKMDKKRDRFLRISSCFSLIYLALSYSRSNTSPSESALEAADFLLAAEWGRAWLAFLPAGLLVWNLTSQILHPSHIKGLTSCQALKILQGIQVLLHLSSQKRIILPRLS